MIPSLYTHLAAAGAAAALAWAFQGARMDAEVGEANLRATTFQLDVSTAQRAADARVRVAENATSTKYQGALNAARTREALLRQELDLLRVASDGLRDQAADAARRLAASPPAPAVTTPLPSTPYTTTAAQRMATWQQKLQATQLMSEPSGTPGR